MVLERLPTLEDQVTLRIVWSPIVELNGYEFRPRVYEVAGRSDMTALRMAGNPITQQDVSKVLYDNLDFTHHILSTEDPNEWLERWYGISIESNNEVVLRVINKERLRYFEIVGS